MWPHSETKKTPMTSLNHKRSTKADPPESSDKTCLTNLSGQPGKRTILSGKTLLNLDFAEKQRETRGRKAGTKSAFNVFAEILFCI
jgi:hypothetical protein